jgi:glycosyltransferase involved in cell wall biosynthesis
MMEEPATTDVCVIVEGAYPFVVGGVSSWLQDLIKSLPELSFSIIAIKAEDRPQTWRIEPPSNVVQVIELPLSFQPCPPRRYPPRQIEPIAGLLLDFLLSGSNDTLQLLLQSLQRLRPRPRVCDVLSSSALFAVMTHHYQSTCPAASFHHFFWAMRTLIGGLLSVLLVPLPKAKVYHTLSTGFAGLVAARAAVETRRPSFITEHGIYQLERHIEVMMADWIGDQLDSGLVLHRNAQDLRDLWLASFVSYARACYDACNPIIALYEANNGVQKRLGAEPGRVRTIPNGIDPARFAEVSSRISGKPLIALIGRVVPIKDIKTFIRATAQVHAELPDSRFAVLGPHDEDPDYAAECRTLVEELGLAPVFEFAGRVDVADWMPKIDVLVLTSLSEAQPLVILEGGACAIPVVCPDVGSCRELVEGRSGASEAPGGIVTPLVDPNATATAIVQLLRDGRLRKRMGRALRARVLADFDYSKIVDQYRRLYCESA